MLQAITILKRTDADQAIARRAAGSTIDTGTNVVMPKNVNRDAAAMSRSEVVRMVCISLAISAGLVCVYIAVAWALAVWFH